MPSLDISHVKTTKPPTRDGQAIDRKGETFPDSCHPVLVVVLT
jgi:hypothetical protein